MPAIPRPRLSPLQWALGISLAAHLVLLGLRLGVPQAMQRAFQSPPLSVVLVNSASPKPVDKPQALAQADLNGGGSARAGLAATPLPDAARTQAGDAARDARTVMQRLEQRERQMLDAAKSQIVTLQHALRAQQTTQQQRTSLEDQHRELLDLIGAIQRRIELNNASPRKRFVGPDTRSVPYALYYDHMREKIERLGTAEFPQRDGRKIYGRLIMAITLDDSGRVLQAEVVQSSGDALLDRMARAIVQAAQPFGDFSPAMRSDADQIEMIAGFDFTRTGALSTDLRANAPPATNPATNPTAPAAATPAVARKPAAARH